MKEEEYKLIEEKLKESRICIIPEGDFEYVCENGILISIEKTLIRYDNPFIASEEKYIIICKKDDQSVMNITIDINNIVESYEKANREVSQEYVLMLYIKNNIESLLGK